MDQRKTAPANARIVRILAIDAATHAGWALGETGFRPNFGTQYFGRGGTGEVLSGFMSWLAQLLQRPPCVTHVVYEKGFIPRIANHATSERLLAMTGIVQALAHTHGVRCLTASPSEISEFFLGTSRPQRRAQKKRATIEMCQSYGFAVDDDNAADALSLWLMAEAKFDPASASRRGDGPLFLPNALGPPPAQIRITPGRSERPGAGPRDQAIENGERRQWLRSMM